MLKDIYQRLGLETHIKKEKVKFYRRINMSVELVIDPFANSENYETYVEIKDEFLEAVETGWIREFVKPMPFIN